MAFGDFFKDSLRRGHPAALEVPRLAAVLLMIFVLASACAGSQRASAPPSARASSTESNTARASAAGDEAELPSDLWPARVLSLLNEKRHEAGLEPLTPSPALGAVAMRAARECFEQEVFDERALLARAHAQLERQTLMYRRVSAVVMLAADPAEAISLDGALDRDARGVGVGVAEQRTAAAQPARVAVVLVFGTPR